MKVAKSVPFSRPKGIICIIIGFPEWPTVWTFPGLVDTQLSPLKMGAGVFNVSESQTEA
jgi:hypothetical protein